MRKQGRAKDGRYRASGQRVVPANASRYTEDFGPRPTPDTHSPSSDSVDEVLRWQAEILEDLYCAVERWLLEQVARSGLIASGRIDESTVAAIDRITANWRSEAPGLDPELLDACLAGLDRRISGLVEAETSGSQDLLFDLIRMVARALFQSSLGLETLEIRNLILVLTMPE